MKNDEILPRLSLRIVKIGQPQSTKSEKFIFHISILSQMQLFIPSTYKEVVYGSD